MDDYKELPLIGKRGEGKVVKVDPDVWEWARFFPWGVTDGGYPQAFRSSAGHSGRLHRIVMGDPSCGRDIHHINRDKLDARRANLQLMDRSEHIWTRGPLTRNGATSKYKGVNRNKARKTPTWIATARIGGRQRYFGTFKSEEEAARAYDAAVLRDVGPHAFLNFPLADTA